MTRSFNRASLRIANPARSSIKVADSERNIQDIFLYAVIVPVIPYALQERAGVPSGDGKILTPNYLLSEGLVREGHARHHNS